ncbi:A/G-specific adenine glycosylase [Ascidiimonas aurantiaca]|uniref:A/G-specific adenine glycosylase n=1 Tax=Ascidiimonas aurantiaca TaxID=1685432 RepID=UPI0030ECF1F1
MDFTEIIIYWYNEHKRDLPWRKTNNPYHIWLSEILLQQTRVVQGLPYYEKFVNVYPTVFDLAAASEDEVLKLWQGLGYYSRARNLHFTAREIVEKYHGKFPDSYRGLLKLKGVGDYTASAIASICFNEPVPVVDGNVYRVLARYFGINTPINSTEGVKIFKEIAKQYISTSQPGTYNQAIMEFGARQCKPQSPHCMFCPLQSNCVAFNSGQVKNLPVKLKKGKVKKRYFNYLVATNKKSTLLQQRLTKDIWQHLYEFPLLESEHELSEEEIANCDLYKNIVGDRKSKLELYNKKSIVHKLSHQHIHTKFWIVHLDSEIENGTEVNTIKEYAFPVLIANFVEDYGF